MAPKAPKSNKKKAKKVVEDESSSSVHSLQQSQSSQLTQRSRAKKYTKDETDALLQICNGFHAIINKNSNSDADRKIKATTWERIKTDFDTYCKSQGIYVSSFFNYLLSQFHLLFSLIQTNLSFIKVDDRSTAQLQSKYRDLKKNARQIMSKAKRDLTETGNRELRSSTVRALNDNALLLALRKNMGPTASGFSSKHGERISFKTQLIFHKCTKISRSCFFSCIFFKQLISD